MACVSLSTAKSCVTLFKSLFVSIHTIYICVPYAMDHIKHSFSAASWAFLWLHILRQFSVSKHWNMDNLWSGWLIAIKNICFSDVTQHFLHCIFMSLRARSEEHTIKKSLSFDQIIFYLPFIIKPKREEKKRINDFISIYFSSIFCFNFDRNGGSKKCMELEDFGARMYLLVFNIRLRLNSVYQSRMFLTAKTTLFSVSCTKK